MLRYIISGHRYANVLISLLSRSQQFSKIQRKSKISYNHLKTVLYALVDEKILEVERINETNRTKFKLTSRGKEVAVKLAEIMQIINEENNNGKNQRPTTN